MKFFSLIIIFLMNMENFNCQEDCTTFSYQKCQVEIYGGDSVEYAWCDNGSDNTRYCGCAVKCNKGPYKGETCKGNCKRELSYCGVKENIGWGIYREGLREKADCCAIAVSSVWLSFSALLIIAVK